MEHIMSDYKGYIEVAAASILFGLIGIFVKFISGMPLGSIIFYRELFGLFFISFYLYARGDLRTLWLQEKKGFIILLGLFQAGTMLAYFTSIKYTTVSIAVLLLYTSPVYVTLLSPLILKEHITRRTLLALPVSILGVIFVIQPGAEAVNGMYIIGIAVGMVSGLSLAAMTLTSRYLRNYYSGTAQGTWAVLITLIIFVPYSGAVPAEILKDNLVVLVLFGLLPTAFATVLYLSGFRHIRAQHGSIIGLIEPISAVALAFIILDESISWITLVGGGLILAAALLVSTDRTSFH